MLHSILTVMYSVFKDNLLTDVYCIYHRLFKINNNGFNVAKNRLFSSYIYSIFSSWHFPPTIIKYSLERGERKDILLIKNINLTNVFLHLDPNLLIKFDISYL